jgi:hypothetical protein
MRSSVVGVVCLACGLLAAPSSGAAEEKKAEKAPENPEPVRGPAENLVIEAVGGYGVGTLTTIPNHDPQVVHGPLYHLALGYAWTIRASNSIGVQLFADGMLDSDRTTGAGAKIAGRYGAAAFMVGQKAHVRLGFGYTTLSAADKQGVSSDYTGLGICFGLGYHFMFGKQTGWKRPALTWEVVPAWDFLNAGSGTLHRLSFGMALGVAIY